MKKILFSLLVLCIANFAFAQGTQIAGSPVYYLNGNVGIGTTSPRSTFNVNGNNGEAWVNQYGHFVFNHKNVSSTHFWTMAPRSNGFLGIGYGSLIDNEYVSSSNDFMTINSTSGHVGIGTTSPGNKLHVEGDLLLDVYGNSGHEKGIFFREGFSTTNKYNVSILAYDHNGGGSSPDGLSINGYDGISFSTGSNSRNERMRIALNGNVGIGITTPNYKLDVAGRIHSNDRIYGDRLSATGGIIDLDAASGSNFWQLYNGTATLYVSGAAGISQKAGNVGIGTSSPTEKLSVNGNILAKKVRVSIAAADWPDYVFKADYKLKSLSELETYITQNQHLPEVPSAEEVEANGLDLGSMDATLLKKVEELTLYLIQENKDKETLKKENMALKNTLNEVLKRLEKLEKD